MTPADGAPVVNNALPSPQSGAAPAQAGGGRVQRNLSPNMLTTPQKAALIIAALGPESAGPIIERVEDKHLRAFARAYAHLHTIPKAALKVVAEEFVGRLSTNDDDIKGGYEETRELLSQFIGSDDITRLMDGLSVPGGESVWEKLDRATDESLAGYLKDQNPQIVAVVLSKINTEKASRILDIFEDEIAMKIIARLAKPMDVKPEVLQVLMKTIERDFLTAQKNASQGRNPGEMIGAMMNNVMSEKRDKLMEYISSEAPEILADVRKSLLTFQDIPERVPPNAISMVVKEIDLDLFLHAVKFGKQNAPSSVDFIFSNISQRMRQQYEEQMEKMKTLPVKEAEAAQATFMTAVRKLVAAGEIELIEIVEEEDEEGASEEGGEE